MSYRGLPDLGFPSAQAFYQASWHELAECLTHHRLNLNLSEYDLLLSCAEWLAEQVPGFKLMTRKGRLQFIEKWCDFLVTFGCDKGEVLRQFRISTSVRGIENPDLKQYDLTECQIGSRYDKTRAKANRHKQGLPPPTSAPAPTPAKKAKKAKKAKAVKAANPVVAEKQNVTSDKPMVRGKDVAVQTGPRLREGDSPIQANAIHAGTACDHLSTCRQCSSLIYEVSQQTINDSRPSPAAPSVVALSVSENTNHDPQLDTRTAIDIFEVEDLSASVAPEKGPIGISCHRCSGQDHAFRDCPTNIDPKFDKPPPGHYKCCACGATGDHYSTLCPFNTRSSSFTQCRKQQETDKRSHDVEERNVTQNSNIHRENPYQWYEGWLESQKERLDQEQHSGGPTTSGSNAIPLGPRETNRSVKSLISRAEAEKQSPAVESRKRKRSSSIILLGLKSNGAPQRDARFSPTLLSGPYPPDESQPMSSPEADTRLAGFAKLLQSPRRGPEAFTTNVDTSDDGRLSPYELSPVRAKKIRLSESRRTGRTDQQIIATSHEQSWEKAGEDADVLLDILREQLHSRLHDHSRRQTLTCEAIVDDSVLNAVSSPLRPGSKMPFSNTANARCDAPATRISRDLTEVRPTTEADEDSLTAEGQPVHEEAIGSFFSDEMLHREVEMALNFDKVVPYQTEKSLARRPPYDLSVVNLFKSRHHPYINTRKCQTAVQMLDRDENNTIEEGEILEPA